MISIVNSRSIVVTRTSIYSYHRSEAASQAKMFFSSFDNSNVVFEVIWQISGNCLLKITRYTGEITMNAVAHTTVSLI